MLALAIACFDAQTRRHAPGGLIYHVLNRGVNWGCPFGEESWRNRIMQGLGLASTLRNPGRPRKPLQTEVGP